jgi:tetratricopeptide (TPR) repeat protein
VRPTHQPQRPDAVTISADFLSRDSSQLPLLETSSTDSRRRSTRWLILPLALSLFGLGSLAAGRLVESAEAAASSDRRPLEALSGPWRWLEPNLEGLRVTGRLMAGPWQDVAITRDPDRRQWLLEELSGKTEAKRRTDEDWRGAQVRPDRPSTRPSSDPSTRPSTKPSTKPLTRASILRRATLESARLLEAAGESAAAAEAYAGAVASREVVLVEVWHGLAVNLARVGDLAGAELAFLHGLDASGRASDQIRFRYELAGFYAQQGRLLESLAVVDALLPHLPYSVELANARVALRASVELSELKAPRAGQLEWPNQEPELNWAVFDPRVANLAERLPVAMQFQVYPMALQIKNDKAVRTTIFSVAAGLLLIAFFVLLRQRGDVAVAIEYPEELRGIFRVCLRGSRRSAPVTSSEEQIRKGRASLRREHHMVSRETRFQRLFTGRYHVMIDGLLIDPETDEVLGRVHEEKVVRVRHRRTVRLEFDIHPSTCPVDVKVVWGDRPASEAQITVPGFVDKPRPATKGTIRVLLPKGNYRLLVGCGDRVFDQILEVASFRSSLVEIDVLNAKAVFKGCPPAVVPYLTGDYLGVAKALERDGQAVLGFRLMANQHQADGEFARAADFFESAGDNDAAAKLRLELGEFDRAAALFEAASNWIEAAEAHRQDNQVLRAGECYERALDYERAIDCYRESGAIDRWLTALERCGEVFPAAKLALEHDQRPRAIRLLQRVEGTDPDIREVCTLLAEAFETEEHFDLAAGKMEEFISTFRPEFATGDSYSRLAELWEKAGHFERSLEVLEDLRRREPTFPNIAARIEALRKQRSASGHLFTSGSRAASGGTTAFVGEVRYDLLEEIGRGGMGVVYRARDTRLDRIVALKRLPDGLRRHHPRALQFFLREAQSAARLNHPNIVTVYDADQEGGQFFITMELLEGQPLQTVLRERGQLSPSNVLGIARQTCRGLDYAHSQSVIHRDIKTANLFVTTDRIVKIMDFGLAKVLEEVRGATTLVSGTPYYMSPEQVLGEEVDLRSDLYSLGVTLFELATGGVPFDSGEIGYHHRHSAVPNPQDLRPDLPDALSQLILKLLEKAPEARFQTAGEVLEALTSIDPS